MWVNTRYVNSAKGTTGRAVFKPFCGFLKPCKPLAQRGEQLCNSSVRPAQHHCHSNLLHCSLKSNNNNNKRPAMKGKNWQLVLHSWWTGASKSCGIRNGNGLWWGAYVHEWRLYKQKKQLSKWISKKPKQRQELKTGEVTHDGGQGFNCEQFFSLSLSLPLQKLRCLWVCPPPPPHTHTNNKKHTRRVVKYRVVSGSVAHCSVSFTCSLAVCGSTSGTRGLQKTAAVVPATLGALLVVATEDDVVAAAGMPRGPTPRIWGLELKEHRKSIYMNNNN